MKFKPKTTVCLPRAKVYKRFTNINRSFTGKTLYKTLADNKFWIFDAENTQFFEIEQENAPQNPEIVQVTTNVTIIKFENLLFRYSGTEWETIESTQLTTLDAKFGNIAKYQTNKYYYSATFDYMIRGSVEGATTQYIKGNIIPLTSFNIKYFDDVGLNVDDLVVIDGRLYSVENPETEHKYSPKDYLVFFATLNNIL